MELLLLERHARANWLGGAWVFPGGRVDDGDRDAMWSDSALGQVELAAAWPGADFAWLRDHAVAAVRELFEETGLLLCDRVVDVREGRDVMRAGPGRIGDERRLLLEGLASFAEICRKRRWRLRLDLLVPFVRWITPEAERRRFDTVFFFAEAPPDAPETHAAEVAGHAWITARDATDRFARDDMAFAPPTLRTLEDLAGCATVGEAMAWARTVPRLVIAPRPHEDDAGRWLLLPGDPLYPAAAGHAVPGPTRFVFDRERWRSAR